MFPFQCCLTPLAEKQIIYSHQKKNARQYRVVYDNFPYNYIRQLGSYRYGLIYFVDILDSTQ